VFIFVGQAVGQLVDSLRYKPESRGFVCLPVGFEIFHCLNPSGRTVGSGIDSASKTKECREYFLVVNAAGT
jgi:hypothetical protein